MSLVCPVALSSQSTGFAVPPLVLLTIFCSLRVGGMSSFVILQVTSVLFSERLITPAVTVTPLSQVQNPFCTYPATVDSDRS